MCRVCNFAMCHQGAFNQNNDNTRCSLMTLEVAWDPGGCCLYWLTANTDDKSEVTQAEMFTDIVFRLKYHGGFRGVIATGDHIKRTVTLSKITDISGFEHFFVEHRSTKYQTKVWSFLDIVIRKSSS